MGRWEFQTVARGDFQTGDETPGSSPGATIARSRASCWLPGGSGGGTSSGGPRGGTGRAAAEEAAEAAAKLDRRLNPYRKRGDRRTHIDLAELPEAMRRAGRPGAKQKRDG
jgi:hypothetical protein